MPQPLIFEDHYKRLGLEIFSEGSLKDFSGDRFRTDIKIFFIPAGYELTVDFNHYKTQKPSLFFLTNQHLSIQKGKEESILLFYNRDFYCIQIHDKEVACDGLLFHNVFEIPFVELDHSETALIKSLFQNIQDELEWKDSSAEEMIRTYVKQIIIRATRKWKKQNLDNDSFRIPGSELDIFRDFSRLLEIHFREKHNVADYAELLHMAPKTLTHKFKHLNLESPNQFIINRILLEAKRLLFYTDKPVKEIAYDLGYEDPAYFNRLFTNKTGNTPANFKKNYTSGKKYNI
ncbi:Bacillibactin transport regulator [Chryseobacterium gleum]|uniref:Bacillibactin transport regulator n=2 Tax=Chryseobacterium gleum TaxID=250 RepID=A0A3S4NWD2_CHRGE|nr:AraC family transcriptional regulator [Chryseobacterium gleum]EFK37745.1 transcriptional regulator, AraC family [Chryseobacterium gleum ATCC 35910]QBJ87486.1 helix-turn-helix domain-containing protein [Chryseobacterium gleum]QQY32778.1 helix-turn-helix domain-containing protein [Chryseobacterium gleum]VEE09985.1 Bacillibactin transport regulator [Chryseobacterium gleum]